ncbi:MAG: bifunctional DNA primase/polymerase [Mesorhizobium sp.]
MRPTFDSTLSDAALAYAADGIAVFPLKPGQKRPLTENGWHAASTDPDLIRTWWKRNPNANIGIPMALNGLVAVDPDLYKTDCGWNTFIDGKDIPSTWTQSSASGGRHIVFRAPHGHSFPKNIAKYVDVISSGYIVAAPSRYGDGIYVRTSDAPPAQAPEWLLNAEPYSQTKTERAGKIVYGWEVDPITGKVIDGRENYMASLAFKHYAMNPKRTDLDQFIDYVQTEYEANAESGSTRITDANIEKEVRRKCEKLLDKRPTVKTSGPVKGIEPEVPLPPLLGDPEDVAAAVAEELDDFLSAISMNRASQTEIDQWTEELIANAPSGAPKTPYEPTFRSAERRLLNAAAGAGKTTGLLATAAQAQFACAGGAGPNSA